VTHEHIPNGEHDDGPEHDQTLPDADTFPVFDDPADSDGPLLEHDLED
jgi:hypothetical protein